MTDIGVVAVVVFVVETGFAVIVVVGSDEIGSVVVGSDEVCPSVGPVVGEE